MHVQPFQLILNLTKDSLMLQTLVALDIHLRWSFLGASKETQIMNRWSMLLAVDTSVSRYGTLACLKYLSPYCDKPNYMSISVMTAHRTSENMVAVTMPLG